MDYRNHLDKELKVDSCADPPNIVLLQCRGSCIFIFLLLSGDGVLLHAIFRTHPDIEVQFRI